MLSRIIQTGLRGLRINLATPFNQLPVKTQTLLLSGGSGFEGISALLQDSFNRSTDNYREYLSEYMSAVPCADCNGKRLRPASLAVRVQGLSIAELTGLPLSRALLMLQSWKLADRELQIVGRVLDEITRGSEEIDRGEGIEHEEVKRRLAKWLGK